MSFALYGVTKWDRGAKARWIFEELGVLYEMQWLNKEQREHEGPEYLKLNPMGRVPLLRAGDQLIIESGAICAYLGDLFGERGIAPRVDSKERAQYLKWMYFAASTIDPFQTRIMIIEDIPQGVLYEKKFSALQSDVRDALGTLDQALTKGEYLLESGFSVADICVSYHLYWTRLWPELEVIFHDFPRVTAYLARLKAMPSAIKANVFSYEA